MCVCVCVCVEGVRGMCRRGCVEGEGFVLRGL